MESLIVFIIVILIVLVLCFWAAEKISPEPRVTQLLQGLMIVLAALAIAHRAGVI